MNSIDRTDADPLRAPQQAGEFYGARQLPFLSFSRVRHTQGNPSPVHEHCLSRYVQLNGMLIYYNNNKSIKAI